MGRAIYYSYTTTNGNRMKFTKTSLAGAFLIEQERHIDQRGYFSRVFCDQEFKDLGLNSQWLQSSVSFNHLKGTLRGLHYQAAPYEEVKLVRCTRGSIYDVIIDLRENSKTFQQWFGAELSEENGISLYIPEGFAHGFITLQADSEVLYQMDRVYEPAAARGIRWDDSLFDIDWTADVVCISDKDANLEKLAA